MQSGDRDVWDVLRLDSQALHDSEPFLKDMLHEIVLVASSFADSIARLLSRSFQGVVEYSAWHSLLLGIFRYE